jgi:hypothetical protein
MVSKASEHTQISVRLNESVFKKYWNIRETLGISSVSTISKGIELLALFVKAGQEGKNFAIVDSEGKTTEVEFKV